MNRFSRENLQKYSRDNNSLAKIYLRVKTAQDQSLFELFMNYVQSINNKLKTKPVEFTKTQEDFLKHNQGSGSWVLKIEDATCRLNFGLYPNKLFMSLGCGELGFVAVRNESINTNPLSIIDSLIKEFQKDEESEPDLTQLNEKDYNPKIIKKLKEIQKVFKPLGFDIDEVIDGLEDFIIVEDHFPNKEGEIGFEIHLDSIRSYIVLFDEDRETKDAKSFNFPYSTPAKTILKQMTPTLSEFLKK